MHWDINKIKEIVKNSKLKLFKVEITNHLINQIDVNSLDKNLVKNPSKDSIILVIYDPVNMLVIIDGNHRVYSVYIRNERTMMEYILEHEYHMKSMIN